MAEITIPSGVRLANLEWQQPPTYAFNRSELTGKSRAIQLGPAQRWSATGRLVPTKGNDTRSVRSFLALMSMPGNTCRLPMVTGSQSPSGYPTTALVNGSGQLGFTLAIKGLQASVTNLKAGDIITVAYILGGVVGYQPIVLGADLVADGSGNANAALTTPLRVATTNDYGVFLASPFALMRMRDPLAWSASPGGISSSEAAFEEAF